MFKLTKNQPGFIFLIIFSLLYGSRSISQTTSKYVPQKTVFKTQPEMVDATKSLSKENQRQFILGTINLCSGEDYNGKLGNMSYSMESNQKWADAINNDEKKWCYMFVTPPHQSPHEFYRTRIEDNQDIMLNGSNPFKLREIRNSSAYKSDIGRISKEAKITSEKSLKFYSMAASVQDYDFDTGKVSIHFRPNLSFGGAGTDPNIKYPSPLKLAVSEQEIQKIYDYYQNTVIKKKGYSLKAYHRNTNTINAIVIYELRPPTRKYSRTFEIVPLKVEFYDHSGWSNKIAEYNYMN